MVQLFHYPCYHLPAYEKEPTMAMKELLAKNRSIRRFHQDHQISMDTLRHLVDCARLSPSARNMQPLRYVLSGEPGKNAVIFSQIGWAGYLPDWLGPAEGERPSAYIILCGDTTVTPAVRWDDGICAHSILLAATEMGLGGCMIGTINRKNLSEALNIPPQYDICLVVALGKPKEQVVIDPVTDGDIKYFRDDRQIHHVPKRSLDEVILNI